MERSFQRLRAPRLDLMQVHNLVDLETQLATMRGWKEAGRIRYLGITHYLDSAFPEVEKILRREKLDFLQINYSIIDRAADERVLPLARDRGVAVLINRPFASGDLFAAARKAAAGVGGGVRLQIVGPVPSQVDPRESDAVTCAIPATGKFVIWKTTWLPASAACRMRKCASGWCNLSPRPNEDDCAAPPRDVVRVRATFRPR